MDYDVIGDIHGQAAKLDALLAKLGYTHTAGAWRAPAGRQAVFVGDLIDRGPEQLRVVDTVRRMLDAGHAHCVMGNHEFNAIAWTIEWPGAPGEFLRSHKPVNADQHREFLQQVGDGSARHRDLLDFFRALPVSLDLGGIRVVHAWWNDAFIAEVERVRGSGPLTDDFMIEARTKGTPLWAAMEGLTKGMEIPLPAGSSFEDKSAVERHEIRACWWLEAAETYRQVALVGDDQLHRVPEVALPGDTRFTPVQGAPVFVGHYWMQGTPRVQSKRVACVDYSAAKGGPLVAYRWSGESELKQEHFVAAG